PNGQNKYLAADGNTFLKYQDNIQGYLTAAAVNYNQGNSCYRPLGVANQTRPPGFAQPNGQNNQNRFSQPQGYNRVNNFNQNTTYQAPTQQNQVVPLSELEKIKKINEINIKAMQTQINNVKNELRSEMQNSIQASMSNQTNELKNMMASFFQMNTASTSGTGSLPSNTVANPKGELKAITTRSGLVLDGPSVPIPSPFINPEEDERVEETLTDPDLTEFTIKVPPPLVQKAKPPSQRNYVVHQRDPRHPHIPYPSRMNQEKQQEKDEVQIHKFCLLSNKEKLLELANTPLSENCSAVILKKLPEKLRDPQKFLIPCGFSELKCKALADLELQEMSLFEEADSFLALEDDPTSSEVDPTYQDPEGDILLLEAILNTKTVESSVDEPPEVELKELPPHLEYAFLEGDDKLPVIIAKDLKDEEKAALLKVLKSHKRAIAWKLSDIKGVSPEFCTHKILIEEDYEPSVQSQRRVNPKIHDVIKKEVEKLLDAGLIYPISDSPWVSPVHCVPKKGGITVITNDENELIPTRLVTGWRVCIDYRKLNEATRKDHFPLPFMDQMLERLAGNQPLLAHTELLPIVACLLGYAMLLARSNDV
ncbi:hypothetical protein Tco_0960984, partial [Tanacetum coccineum]